MYYKFHFLYEYIADILMYLQQCQVLSVIDIGHSSSSKLVAEIV